MLLILTNSRDVTTDLLIPHLKCIEFFRLDIDKYADYGWDFTNKGFAIAHRDGKRISSENITAIYERKLCFADVIDVPALGCEENWRREEIMDLIYGLIESMHAMGRAALVYAGNGRWRKLRQMKEAAKYFTVPEWHIWQGIDLKLPANKTWVVKTLTQLQLGDGGAIFVRSVDPAKLDAHYPWFLQEKVEAQEDVTVVYVKGTLFAYALDRSTFNGEDYRFDGAFTDLPWRKVTLTRDEQDSMRTFMQDTGYDFGRFDFLRKNGKLYFLEMNPNGQWAWLDIKNRDGLFTAIADEIIQVASLPPLAWQSTTQVPQTQKPTSVLY